MAPRLDMTGADLGVHTVTTDHPYTLPIRFWADRAKTVPVDVSAYTWRVEVRADKTSTAADATLTVTTPEANMIIVTASKAQMQALGALGMPGVFLAVDQVAPTDRPMFRAMLAISQDAAH